MDHRCHERVKECYQVLGKCIEVKSGKSATDIIKHPNFLVALALFFIFLTMVLKMILSKIVDLKYKTNQEIRFRTKHVIRDSQSGSQELPGIPDQDMRR